MGSLFALLGSRRVLSWPLLVVVVATIWFGTFALLDPDPHHDGYQFTSALGVSEGLGVHREVLSQYGPVAPWFNAIPLRILGPQLVWIRLLGALLLIVASLLTYLVARRANISPPLGTALVFLWIAMAPPWAVVSDEPWFQLWPWPSVPFLVLQLLVTLQVMRTLRQPIPSTNGLLVAGFLVGLATSFRLNLGVILLMATLVTVVSLATGSRFRAATVLLLAWVAPLLVVATVLVIDGALIDFIHQSILGPLGAYTDREILPTLRFAFGLGSLPVIVGSSIFLTAVLRSLPTRFLWKLAVTAATITLGVLLFAYLSVRDSTAVGQGLPMMSERMVNRATALLELQLVGPMYAAAVVLPILAVMIWWRKYDKVRNASTRVGIHSIRNRQSVPVIVIAVLGISSLAQLYPAFDVYHLWYAAPLPLIAIPVLLKFSRTWPPITAMAVVLIGPFIAVNAASAVGEVLKPRVFIESGALAGMMVRQSSSLGVTQVNALLSEVTPQQAEVMCSDGLVAGWNGRYLPNGPLFVDWDWINSAEQDSRPPSEFLVVCSALGESEDFSAQAIEKVGYRVVGRVDEVELSRFSAFSLVVLKRHEDL